MINFPDNPTVNQVFTAGLQTWIYDGAKWVAYGVAQGIYLPLTGGKLTGALNPAGGIIGVTDGSSAAPGMVGEVVSANPAAGVPLTSSVIANLTSILLTAGDWDVWGLGALVMSGAVASVLQGGISLTSAVNASNPPVNGTTAVIGASASLASCNIAIPPVAFSFTAPTRVYLNCFAAFASGTASGGVSSFIQARRMR